MKRNIHKDYGAEQVKCSKTVKVDNKILFILPAKYWHLVLYSYFNPTDFCVFPLGVIN